MSATTTAAPASSNRSSHDDVSDALAVRPTRHAVERWAERVRVSQDLPARQAREDLLRCCQTGRPSVTPPAWLQFSQADGYLLLGDDVCLPVAQDASGELVVLTVLTKWDEGSVYLAQRRSERRARLRSRRRKHHEGPAARRRRESLRPQPAPTVPWHALQRAATNGYVIAR